MEKIQFFSCTKFDFNCQMLFLFPWDFWFICFISIYVFNNLRIYSCLLKTMVPFWVEHFYCRSVYIGILFFFSKNKFKFFFFSSITVETHSHCVDWLVTCSNKNFRSKIKMNTLNKKLKHKELYIYLMFIYTYWNFLIQRSFFFLCMRRKGYFNKYFIEQKKYIL